MLKFIGDLDKKNKQLTNLALLPGFNFEDSSNYSKKHNKYNDSICNLDSTTDKIVISDKTFNKFYRVIDSAEKKVLSGVMIKANMRLSKQAIYIYNKE
jgi:hypothetical protein